MSEKKVIDNGGLVFNMPEYGMSLRDHFAGLCMQSILSEKPIMINPSDPIPGLNDARWAYQFADAMIEARK